MRSRTKDSVEHVQEVGSDERRRAAEPVARRVTCGAMRVIWLGWPEGSPP